MEEEERNRRGMVSLLSTVSSVRETVGDKYGRVLKFWATLLLLWS